MRSERSPDEVQWKPGLGCDPEFCFTLIWATRYQVQGGELWFGTDRVYGATYQFGHPEDGIPARP